MFLYKSIQLGHDKIQELNRANCIIKDACLLLQMYLYGVGLGYPLIRLVSGGGFEPVGLQGHKTTIIIFIYNKI